MICSAGALLETSDRHRDDLRQRMHHFHGLFSLDVKYGDLLDTTMHMQRHRVGARGNATFFPNAMASYLAELMRLDESAEHGEAPYLPRTGEDLKHVVQVLLNTSDEDKRGNLKHFIHQTKVRREVVVALILGAKARGHRAYQHLDENTVRAKAQNIPANGVPPELLHGLPDDKSLDNIQIPKAATPVEGMHTYLERAKDSFREQRPLAVVLEGSANDAMDISMRRVHALNQ